MTEYDYERSVDDNDKHFIPAAAEESRSSSSNDELQDITKSTGMFCKLSCHSNCLVLCILNLYLSFISGNQNPGTRGEGTGLENDENGQHPGTSRITRLEIDEDDQRPCMRGGVTGLKSNENDDTMLIAKDGTK